MWSFGIDADEERLSDSKCRQALAALARRRQEALARHGRGGAAYVNYMATTLPHYLHQVRTQMPGQGPGDRISHTKLQYGICARIGADQIICVVADNLTRFLVRNTGGCGCKAAGAAHQRHQRLPEPRQAARDHAGRGSWCRTARSCSCHPCCAIAAGICRQCASAGAWRPVNGGAVRLRRQERFVAQAWHGCRWQWVLQPPEDRRQPAASQPDALCSVAAVHSRPCDRTDGRAIP